LFTGVTGATYTLAAANLSDDGAVFRVVVAGLNGIATAQTRLAVSSMPGVVFEDGEFLDSDWAATAVADPPLQGSTASASRVEAGGNPGAFRSLTHQLPADAVPRSVRLFNTALLATYDPATQGAIYVIEFLEDCTNVAGTANLISFTLPMFEQAGRRYTASDDFGSGCPSPGWYGRRFSSSYRADYFLLADGPACGAGESCPNFSAGGAPIRFGFVSAGKLNDGTPSGSYPSRTGGIDNWKVTVWRR
jgi:hypothetical protein